MKLEGRREGWTLLELMVALGIVLILSVMLVPAASYVRGRMDRAACVNNLKGLYMAAASHIQEQESWPQVPTSEINGPGYARAWIAALKPYGLTEPNWHCPSVERSLGRRPKPGEELPPRIDYYATPFGSGSRAPYRWATQPWFAERGDVHGEGNLLILGSGEVLSLHQVYRDARFRQGGNR